MIVFWTLIVLTLSAGHYKLNFHRAVDKWFWIFFRLEIFLVSLTDKNDLLHMKICFIYENAMLNSSLKWYQNPRDAMKWTYSEHNRRTIHEWAMRSFYCVWIGHTQCVQCSVFRMFAWIHLILMRLLWISLCAGSTHRRAKYDRLAQYQPVNTLGMNSSTYDIFNVIFTYSYDAYVAGNIFIHVWSLLANKKNERKTGMKIPTCYGNVSIWFHAFRNFTK